MFERINEEKRFLMRCNHCGKVICDKNFRFSDIGGLAVHETCYYKE